MRKREGGNKEQNDSRTHAKKEKNGKQSSSMIPKLIKSLIKCTN